jgi:trehalose synthase
MFEVPVSGRPAERLRTMAGREAGERYDALVREAWIRLRDRRIWHINATAEGGGVAEILGTTLGYLSDDGIETRWLVIEADAPFFEITKRIHNRLHGDLGDGGPLGSAERRRYDETLRRELDQILAVVGPGDVVVVHDPQPLGLVPDLRAAGATVVWTCHVGADTPSDVTRSAWAFLRDDASAARATTFTRRAYAWEGLDAASVHVIPPCIDPLSLKNTELAEADVASILGSAAIHSGGTGSGFQWRGDGSQVSVVRAADMNAGMRVPPDAPLVVQVSRWDVLKDPVGVMIGFAETQELADTHLVLAGPAPSSVADDPEAEAVLRAVRQRWERLGARTRARVHVANLPVDDADENALVVNALQRRADVVVQKSLAEGFGLTVTEAMWKSRPVVAGGVGGIRDQIDDQIEGILIDPRDLGSFGAAVAGVIGDPVRAAELGRAARRRVEERYLPTRYLGAYLELFLRFT